MKIPYGISNFGDMRREGYFYADKTPFLPVLESAEAGYRYLLFLRPRRMGKSLLLSMLEHYYDLRRADEFDALFGGLWIHEQPTPERSRYLILSLDFSAVASDGGPDELRRSFLQAVRGQVLDFVLSYQDRIPRLARLDEELGGFGDADAILVTLMAIVRTAGHRLYVLIDEYDTFANSLLSAGKEDLYSAIVERTGFVRAFYRTLKMGTRSGAVARMFITGVSPILLDDLASGFNIAFNVSQDHRLNTLAGFTREEVERAVDEFLVASPEIADDPGLVDREALLGLLSHYYNGYRFSRHAAERMFNADMVLYFLRELSKERGAPADMLDPNVRTDYARLQRLGLLTGTGGATRRALLQTILSEGFAHGRLVEQFGVKSLSSYDQFLSLLYYIGMLTLGQDPPDTTALRLEIPNRVIRELQWSHLALMLKEQEGVEFHTEELEEALRRMAVEGDIEPFLTLFHARVVKAMGVKDLRQFSEKSLKLMLMTFISLSRMFHPLSEKEFAQGYCDLFLGVSPLVPVARYAWLLELKYLPTDAKAAEIEAAFAEAEKQVARYASDQRLVPLLTRGRDLKAGSLVFVGAQSVSFRAAGGGAESQGFVP
ncbi:MAG TPA: AAA family ATPase [Candidatus Nanopelagicales bacterium]|nr:AAA family ATPase [Candidatus Nanopelagicales bacterium]